jgi:TRAP transporter 4TM/12TM fusion protein
MTQKHSPEELATGPVIAEGVDEEPTADSERRPTGPIAALFFWLGVAFTVWHLFTLNLYPIETWTFRIIHVMGGSILGFGLFAVTQVGLTHRNRAPRTSMIIAVVTAVVVLSALQFLVRPLFGGGWGEAAASGGLGFWLYALGGAAVLASLLAAALAPRSVPGALSLLPPAVSVGGIAIALSMAVYALYLRHLGGVANPPPWVFDYFAIGLVLAVLVAVVSGWIYGDRDNRVSAVDWVLIAGAVCVAFYMIFNLQQLQFRAGVLATRPDFLTAFSGIVLILELTRRLAGLALPIIAMLFVAYVFVGPELPGFLHHNGATPERFFSYLYALDGVFGVTTAVSSTYIILFIIFGAMLQVSKVGDYFVNFAFSIAGAARGGPAKVAVFASALMGTINGTSAGNVVATGSMTIPLMKRVGYSPRSAGAIEAAASTGGQILPPVMGAGAFIMAEVTEIPYTEIIVAATIPALLYFVAIFFMVDGEALKRGLRGIPRKDLPVLRDMLKRVYLFAPLLILIVSLFSGNSVIRAGSLALIITLVVATPWRYSLKLSLPVAAAVFLGVTGLNAFGILTVPSLLETAQWEVPRWMSIVAILAVTLVLARGMGFGKVIKGLELGARMSIQILAVCACAGIIVGVIAFTGVGGKFANILLALAEGNQLIALLFAMLISIILGMGMPTTAAYAVAASVVAPGLQRMGIDPLIAHLFIFYFAVISAITPPVALAAYAGAGISGANPMSTSVESFKVGLAAFIVPFMFFYSPALLLLGDDAFLIVRVIITALIGVYLLASAAQGYLLGLMAWPLRILLLAGAMAMISGTLTTDALGIALALAVVGWQWKFGRRVTPAPAAGPTDA